MRRELETDRAAVRRLHAAAFARPELGGSEAPEAGLVDRLRESGDLVPRLSLVAVEAGSIVGHVVCSRGSIGADFRPLLGLGPLGVLPARQRRGVGEALMHAVLGAADALDEPAVVLVGDPAYYVRFGFEPAARFGVVPPVPSWGPAFQLRRLTAWDPRLTGTYRYAAPFDEL